jgi:hypothetical protein
VSIHFAQKNFEKYKMLIRIEAMAKQGQKLRSKQRKLTAPNATARIEQEVQVTKQHILDETKNY